MPPEPNYIPFSKLPALCRLISDDLRMPEHARASVVASLVHWWNITTEKATLSEIKSLFLLLASTPLAPLVVKQLVPLIETNSPTVNGRTIELLQHFPASGEDSVPVLLAFLVSASGPLKWRTAATLSELGLSDAKILETLPFESSKPVSEHKHTFRPIRSFDISDYQVLYEATNGNQGSGRKGSALENGSWGQVCEH
jgi:hypothetical protein